MRELKIFHKRDPDVPKSADHLEPYSKRFNVLGLKPSGLQIGNINVRLQSEEHLRAELDDKSTN